MKEINKEINRTLIDDINRALDKGLTSGLGNPIEGEMCIEALICFKLGLPHSDKPPCVGEEVRKTKIALNDCEWSSNTARANGMRKLAIAQLGSNKLDQEEFKRKLFAKSCQRILPLLIDTQIKDTQKEYVNDLKMWQDKFRLSTEENVQKLWKAFYSSSSYYSSSYYSYYYSYYYYSYSFSYYYSNYYSYYYSYYKNDDFLMLIADTILEVLKDMNSEGCKWL